MNQKKRTAFAATLTLLAAAMFAAAFVPTDTSLVDAVPDGSSENPYSITIEVDQEYVYKPVFNISNVIVSAIIVDAGTNIDVDCTAGVITITGSVAGEDTVKITGTSQYISTNTKDQFLKVTVVAALEITTTELTFYNNVAGQSQYVSSSNDTLAQQTAGTSPVVYSAEGLPSGLKMDAGGNGLIYGKATVLNETGNTVAITATNTETGISVTDEITVKVVANPSSFTLSAGAGTLKTGEKYYVMNSVTEFSFAITGVTANTGWTVSASGDFADKMEYSVSGGNLTFEFGTGEPLSGDYVVYVTYTDTSTGYVTETYVVIHFQAPLGYDTAPKASYYVSYSGTGSGLETVTA